MSETLNGCIVSVSDEEVRKLRRRTPVELLIAPRAHPPMPTAPQTFDDGRTMLRADYSIDCDAAEYSAYRALAVTMAIAYPIGSLAIYSAVLWKYRHLLYPHQIHGRPTEDNTIAQEAKRANAQTIQPFALLHDACERVGVSIVKYG